MAFDLSIPSAVWVGSDAESEQWIDRYSMTHVNNGGLGLDSETTGLHRQRDSIVIWSISDGQTRLCLDRKYIAQWRQPILENPNINFDLTNAKFDAHMFANSGADISKAGQLRDTVSQSWLYNENNTGRHGLKECTVDHFGRVTPKFELVFGKIPPARKDKLTGEVTRKTTGELIREAMADPTKFDLAVDYASLDAFNSTMLRHRFDELLDRESIGWGSLKDYYYEFEVPFTKVLYRMERRGITVDKGYLMSQQGPMEARMEEIKGLFIREYGEVINLNSVIHMRKFFLDHLGLTSPKTTKGGKSGVKSPSIDAEVLELWAGEGNTWAQTFLDYRSIAKIHGTYVEGLQFHIDAQYRIHTIFNQSGTVTGRLSSSEPNLQNLPRASEDAFKIREAFIGGERKVLLVADYEQLEMRLMAHFSGDQKMIQAIRDGKDLHCYTTSEMEGIDYDLVMKAKKAKKHEMTPEYEELLLKRQNNKGTGFGIIYGIGGPKLAAKLTREGKKLVTEQEGWMLIDKWLNVFPGVRTYIEHTKALIKNVGYVQVATGRKRRFGDLRTMSRRDASACERQGVNSVIQGTAAEIAKVVMIKCENDPKLNDLRCSLLLQIHDELVFEVPDDPEIYEAAKARVKEIMEHPFSSEFQVALPVSIGIASSWAEAK
jgi:DNA polymerase-1